MPNHTRGTTIGSRSERLCKIINHDEKVPRMSPYGTLKLSRQKPPAF